MEKLDLFLSFSNVKTEAGQWFEIFLRLILASLLFEPGYHVHEEAGEP